jgi:pantoate--beta-alanine ligase
MIIYKHAHELLQWLEWHKTGDKVIGFVPTMGALHKGHLSLVQRSKEECDHTIVSIFVNPRQFNDADDLNKYPRPMEADLALLESVDTDIAFVPDVIDIYPSDDLEVLNFDPGPAAKTMEGEFRPGHFQGMAEVVYRLLNLVQPHKLFMGQKDFQQLAVVRKLIADLELPVQLEMCPTVREANGLAMSSRNERLTPEARQKAGIIYDTLGKAQHDFDMNIPVDSIKASSMEALRSAGFDPEYFEIVDGVTFQPVTSRADSQFVVACCAVRVEGIRLIDNAIWTKSE